MAITRAGQSRGERRLWPAGHNFLKGSLEMPYALFYSLFPEIAEKETRTVSVFDSTDFNLPQAHYSFLEMFCDEPGCDCRRVFFSVTSSVDDEIKAVIAWGWEDRDFYCKWMGDDDPNVIEALMGPELNLSSPQSNLGTALLDLFQRTLLSDNVYIERVKRHYAMFRKAVDSKTPKKGPGKKKKITKKMRNKKKRKKNKRK
ncbi:MAG: hypothetical protein GY859_25500 [Desulfobacterales bacterium]|nr:hypothetical protein [Desulfobacterales bacterium]